MEVATLFTINRVFGLKAGAICGVIVNRNYEENIDQKIIEGVEKKLARVSVQAAKILLTQNEISH